MADNYIFRLGVKYWIFITGETTTAVPTTTQVPGSYSLLWVKKDVFGTYYFGANLMNINSYVCIILNSI